MSPARRAVRRKVPRPGALSAAARRKLARVELLLLDVDGVLTDGSIVMGETALGDDFELKAFHPTTRSVQQTNTAGGVINISYQAN